MPCSALSGRLMVELYLEARLHNRISDADYRALLLRQDLDHQEQKLRQTPRTQH